jgi:hypothetical protein
MEQTLSSDYDLIRTAKHGMRFDNRYCWVMYFGDVTPKLLQSSGEGLSSPLYVLLKEF